MKAIFLFNFLVIALFLEAVFASKLIYLPFSFMICFYFSVYFKWRTALLITIVCALAQQELFQVHSLLAMLSVFIFAKIWKNQGDCSRSFVQWPAYAGAHFIAAFIQISSNNELFDLKANFLRYSLELFLSTIVLALCFPFFIQILDYIAGKLEIQKYTTTQREELLNARP